jgi:hypothetical protein
MKHALKDTKDALKDTLQKRARDNGLQVMSGLKKRELLVLTCCFLDVDDVSTVRLVAKNCKLAADDDRIWGQLCKQLWATKKFVPTKYRDWNAGNISARAAFVGSIEDSTRAKFDSTEEFCSIIFEFRFKVEAGAYWLGKDPASRGLPPMLRRFCKDGTTNVVGNAEQRQHDLMCDPEVSQFLPSIRWQWKESAERKHYLQINDWPWYSISRSSVDWSWKMDSKFIEYSSHLVGAIPGESLEQIPSPAALPASLRTEQPSPFGIWPVRGDT